MFGFRENKWLILNIYELNNCSSRWIWIDMIQFIWISFVKILPYRISIFLIILRPLFLATRKHAKRITYPPATKIYYPVNFVSFSNFFFLRISWATPSKFHEFQFKLLHLEAELKDKICFSWIYVLIIISTKNNRVAALTSYVSSKKSNSKQQVYNLFISYNNCNNIIAILEKA